MIFGFGFLQSSGSSSTGTVTSVGLSLPAEFTISGSPVTTSGTLTGTWANQTQNLVFASPNGSTGTPSFRALVAADIPSLSSVYVPYTGATTDVDLNAKSLKNFFISKTADVTAKFAFDVSALSAATTRTLAVPDRSFTLDNITTATTTNLTGYLKGNGTVASAQTVPIPATDGGTGQTVYAVGDLLYASTTTVLSKLADVATGNVLISGGVGVAPSWSSSPTLTTSLTSPLLIGGTGTTSTLTFRTTTGVGTTGSDFIWQQGNNGATETMRLLNSGALLVGTTAIVVTGDLIVARKNQAAETNITVTNSSASNGAYATHYATNGTTNAYMGVNGSGNTGGGVFGTAHMGYTGSGNAAGFSIVAANASGAIHFYTGGSASGNEVANLNSSGRLYIGGSTSATALLHFKAGTATAGTAPLKFTISGATLLTSAEAGAMEVSSDNIYYTISTGTARKIMVLADPSGGLTSGRVPYATTNGRLTDNSAFVFDGTNLGVGAATPAYLLDVRNNTNTAQIHVSGSNSDEGMYMLGYKSGATHVANVALNAAFNGTNWVAKATTSSSVGQNNGVIQLFTDSGLTVGNTFTPTLRMKVTELGSVVVGTSALSTSATDGFFYIPTCAGTPTGVPTTQNSTVAMVYDSTNNKIYVYNGAWKATAALT